jgi:hypothetical protein
MVAESRPAKGFLSASSVNSFKEPTEIERRPLSSVLRSVRVWFLLISTRDLPAFEKTRRIILSLIYLIYELTKNISVIC